MFYILKYNYYDIDFPYIYFTEFSLNNCAHFSSVNTYIIIHFIVFYIIINLINGLLSSIVWHNAHVLSVLC